MKVLAFIILVLLVFVILIGAGEATCRSISFFDTTCGKWGCMGGVTYLGIVICICGWKRPQR